MGLSTRLNYVTTGTVVTYFPNDGINKETPIDSCMSYCKTIPSKNFKDEKSHCYIVGDFNGRFANVCENTGKMFSQLMLILIMVSHCSSLLKRAN